MRRRLPGGLLAALMAVALIGTAPGAPRAVEPILTDTVIQTGLQRPWDIAFAPDGRMFVSERPGRVVIFASAAPGAPRLNTVAIDGVLAVGE
jgi:glucose/arabinose dehydrogenase